MSEDDLPGTDDGSKSEENSIKINENFIIKLTNQNTKIIDRNSKENCKILQISAEYVNNINYPEPQLQPPPSCYATIISALDPSEYPNLFIFIIEKQNLNILNENQDEAKVFIKFGAARPLIIHQENKKKIYYKAESSSEIVDIDQHYNEDNELYKIWKNILSAFDKELQPFENEMLIKLSYTKDSSIILRFLRTLNVPESFFEKLVRYIAVEGSKADLLAILDASFEDNGRVLSDQAQNYIQNVFEDDETDEEESDDVESDSEQLSDEESKLKDSSDEDQDDPMEVASSQSETEDSIQSILLTAVQSSNLEIIDYLITYWTHLIQKLPVEHQIRISTTAFDKNQLDVLSDLLEFSDFPFPDGFNVLSHQVNHQRLQSIITDRIKFHEAVEQENEKEIKDFIEKNVSPKFIYSPRNITAMKKAIDEQKYNIYFYLKSFGLCASEFRNLQEVLDENELKKANDQANVQETKSISDASPHASKSVLILCTRALIHNRKVKKEDETNYRKCIKKWLEDVNKEAKDMLDVAASCDNVVIIFDFESKYVNRTAFRDNALGLSSDTVRSRIFIGAKVGDINREKEIKGVLAHELCHYVMSLVYNNKFHPYYKHATSIHDKFDGIVKSIDRWSTTKSNFPDDECNGIISSVFTKYPVNCFHFELIVRAVHILVMYADDPTKSKELQQKYQNLFDFWNKQVHPELEKYLQKNKIVIRINATIELLSSLAKSKIEFSAPKDVERLTKNRIIIVTTNVSKLLLINIHKYLQEIFGCLLESQNVFLEPEKIKNEQVWKDLMNIYARDVKLNIFVDCTKGHLDNLSRILRIDDFKLTLVASNDEQTNKLNEICIKKEIKPTTTDIKYSWSDLTAESQIMLLQTKITFQNNSKISLMELLSKNTNPDKTEIEEILNDFSKIINDHVFNLIIDKQEISINLNVEDSKSKNFEILFLNRDFLKKGINFKNEISQEKLISITANQKHVLISDIAGSGKSWVVKNISKIIMQQIPKRWVTYVDLKQFIEEFNDQPKNCEFVDFFIDKILKPKTEFEEEIFRKLYKIGKVSIIFDGFDEIAPNCADFVGDLAELFEFNDGNQLWIVTRDYFEVNLQDKLKINNVYKLNEFTEEDGIKFIVSSWILKDLKDQTVANFENHMKNAQNLPKYQHKATKIVHKITMSKHQSVGLPQLFSMIADGFKDDKIKLDDLKGSKIFTKFVQIMYIRWLKNGQLREDANAVSLDYDLNFKEFHQYCAILSLFPELIDSLFPGYDKSEWPEVEIVAGGLMNKIGTSYAFIHETFREYFVADFIFKAVKKLRKEIFELLIKVLTIQKYGIIRMFLNDFIENSSIMEKVQLELEKSVEKFINMENLSEYFTENQEQLAKCVTNILKNGEYENVKKIISENIRAIATNTKDLKMFSKFTEFLLSNLTVEDLKDIIKSKNILHKMIGSEADADIIEYFVQKLKDEVGEEFIQEELKLIPSGPENGNIFYHLGSSLNLCKEKVQKCFEIIQKYLLDSEIIELMEKCTEDEQTVLKILVENTNNFKPFFDGADLFYSNQNVLQKFKNILIKLNSSDENILHWSAAKEGIDFHTSVWKIIQKTFENQEELKTFVLKKDKLENNFLFRLLIQNKSEIIEFTLNKLKDNFSESNYQEILRSKGFFGRSLMQCAAIVSKEVITHQILWKTIQNSFKSNEDFLKIFEEVDNDGSNVLDVAVAFTTDKILLFMEEELEKLATREQIRKMFKKFGFGNTNLLQEAAKQNKYLEFHKMLWKILRKYFNSAEILEFIKNHDIFGNNLLINVVGMNTKEVAELTWKEVKEVLEINNLITEELKENIQRCENIIKSISGPSELEKDDQEILKLKWIKNKNSEVPKLFDEVIQASVEQNLNVNQFENLIFFITDENVENHKNLWENLIKIYKNRGDLNKLLFKTDKNGNNFIHLLVIFNTAEVFEFTLQKIKENLSKSDYQEILRSKGQFARNLHHRAAVGSKEIQTHQILWTELRDSCESNEEFLKILEEVDEDGNNFFHLAAAFTTCKVFEFMENEFSKIASSDEIRKYLMTLGYGNRNFLQSAALQNKSLELHEALWKVLFKNFNSLEILEFIKSRDIYGDNLLIIAKKYSTKEILELAWTKVKYILREIYTDTESVQKIKEITESKDIRDADEELLNLEWIKVPNFRSSDLFNEFNQDSLKRKLNVQTLDDLTPMINNRNILNHEILWEHLLNTFENRQDLVKLLSEKIKNDNNFIHFLVIFNTPEIIQLTIQKLKENLNEKDYHEVLRSKGEFDRNLLQLAAVVSKEVRIHQILWNALHDSCKSTKEFLDILGEVDEDGDNIFNLAATFTTIEVFKFMQKELEKYELIKDVKKLLINLGFNKLNLLQVVVVQSKHLEIYELIWEILEKYFDPSEILQFIKHRDVCGHNVLQNVIIGNNKEVKQLTWNKVSKSLINIGYENNENIKKCDELMKISKKLTKEEKEILKLDWIDSKNSVQLFEDNIQLLMQKPISDISLKDLKSIMADENVKNHEIIWKYLEKNWEKYEEIKKLFFAKEENGNNFIHLIFIFNTPEIIQFTIQKLKENLRESDYQEMLRSKGHLVRNLLQIAAGASKEVKTYEILWKSLQNSCKTNEEFLEIIKEVDVVGNDVFNLSAAFTSGQVFEFMISEIERFTNNIEIKKLLTSFGKSNVNLLHSVVIQNQNLEANKTVWKIICKYFDAEEILEFIDHLNDYGDNLLCCAVFFNAREIAEFTWNQIKKFIITKDAQIEYLNRKGQQGKSLHQLSLENLKNDSQVVDWVTQIMQEYEINNI